MIQQAIPAVFMRGGTSKALMLHARDLPRDRKDWAPLLTAAMGTPDPYRPAARRHGRRRVLAVQGLRHRPVGAGRRR